MGICVIYVCVHMCISAHRSQKTVSDLQELVTGSCVLPTCALNQGQLERQQVSHPLSPTTIISKKDFKDKV